MSEIVIGEVTQKRPGLVLPFETHNGSNRYIHKKSLWRNEVSRPRRATRLGGRRHSASPFNPALLVSTHRPMLLAGMLLPPATALALSAPSVVQQRKRALLSSVATLKRSPSAAARDAVLAAVADLEARSIS